MTKGWFAIGIEHTKTETNVGTLWRTAFSMGAAYVFTVGRRYQRQASDTTEAWRHIPLFHFANLLELREHQPHDALLVGVELVPSAAPISGYKHPERAVYLLGAEDHGLSGDAIMSCQQIVVLPGQFCHNVAGAGAMAMYDRHVKTERVNR